MSIIKCSYFMKSFPSWDCRYLVIKGSHSFAITVSVQSSKVGAKCAEN
jgi:hypothetical protein